MNIQKYFENKYINKYKNILFQNMEHSNVQYTYYSAKYGCNTLFEEVSSKLDLLCLLAKQKKKEC